MLKRKLLLIVSLLMFLLAVSVAAAQSDNLIGVSVPSAESVYYTALLESAQKTADSLGVKLVVMDAKSSVDTETANVQALIGQGVKALLFAPVDPVASAASVEAANTAGVPVFLIGSLVEGAPLFNIGAQDTGTDTLAAMTVTDVANNATVQVADVIDSGINEEGALAATTLCDKLANTGTVLELVGFPAVPAADAASPESVIVTQARDRSASLNSALTATCPEVKVQTLDITGLDKKALQDAYVAAIKSADAKGVVGYDSEALLSAVEANVISRQTGVTLLGFEPGDSLLGAIEAGRLTGVIVPDPAKLGESSVKTVVDYLKGLTVAAPGVDVAPTMFDSKMLEAVRGGRKLS